VIDQILHSHIFPLRILHTIFFFNAPAPPEIYTLSLHDALPICLRSLSCGGNSSKVVSSLMRNTLRSAKRTVARLFFSVRSLSPRSEEHTSELQSRSDLVCRLLLEKKKKE